MADLEDVTLDGKPLHSLRVADLKSALEQRGLPKSGQKNALIKRLKGALMLEDLQRISTPHVGLQPNSQVGEEMSQNSFIKQYLAKQQELLRQRLEREAGPGSLAGPDNDDDVTESGDITSCTPVEQCSGGPTPHLAEEVMSSEVCVLLPPSSAPLGFGCPAPCPAPCPALAPATGPLPAQVPVGPSPSPQGASDDDEDSDEEWGVVRAGLRRPGHSPSFPLPDTPKQSPPQAPAPPCPAPAVSTETHGPASQEGGAEGGRRGSSLAWAHM
ncbi:apoptotic chromatin condensation inducer in the nucleus-like [Conger conger]|uniref:apoptotic chromatin condensation inducer in the nucleus-like n=1 Tax=Conger conger TaxID=82655 RepID=UPI002A5A5488|nr:apoptotic chromatin condensation inducer in the nucleus-like [Conger conger]